MRKIKYLFAILLSLTLFCGCNSGDTSNPAPIDVSYEHVRELQDFKCYITYLDKSTTVGGEKAKELYKKIIEAKNGIEHSPANSESNYAYIVFYNDEGTYPTSYNQEIEFYGCYSVYADGLLSFSASPYNSAVLSYQLKDSILDSVIGDIFP